MKIFPNYKVEILDEWMDGWLIGWILIKIEKKKLIFIQYQ